MTVTSPGVVADWQTTETADGPMRLYRGRPTTPDPEAPPHAVIVLQEAFGVNAHIQDVVQRLAAEGYHTVAPDLFHRSGVEVVDYADRDTAMRLIAELGPDSVISDVRATVAHLTDTEQVPVDRIAVVGFCFGGRAAFTAATALPVAAAVVFYGPGIAAGPHAVLDRVAGIEGRVLMFAGDADPTIPAADLTAIENAARSSDVDLRTVVFPGAGHAFHCDARPAQYVPDAARQAWQETLAFLSHTLKSRS